MKVLKNKKFTIPTEEILNKLNVESDKHKLWKGSKLLKFANFNNQKKGKFGVLLVKSLYEEGGHEVQEINDEGDLMVDGDRWEVKTAKADVELKKRTGIVNEELWFNQIRPKQEGWIKVALVGIYPEGIKIWVKSRKEFLDKVATMSSTSSCLTHVGTEDLAGVLLKKNSKRDNFYEWEEVYSDEVLYIIR